MPKTAVADVIIPTEFEKYAIERTAELSRFGQSGIVEVAPPNIKNGYNKSYNKQGCHMTLRDTKMPIKSQFWLGDANQGFESPRLHHPLVGWESPTPRQIGNRLP